MLKIGLTGGIASGKSTVAEWFRQLGVVIIDADVIAHELVTVGSAALTALIKHFGKAYLTAEGTLNRVKLGELIFADSRQKKALDAIMHPLIYAEIRRQLAQYTDEDYVLLVIPLLIETQMQALVDYIVVVDCSLDTQKKRLAERKKISEAAALAMINKQANRAMRLQYADMVINNEYNSSDLQTQVMCLHSQFSQQAR